MGSSGYSSISSQLSSLSSIESQEDILNVLPKKKEGTTKNNGLKQCFSALVDRKQVSLELDVLRLMLRKELGIHLDRLDAELSDILPYILVYYIKNWPGWQRSVEYYSGQILFKTWYEKFHKFITFKLNDSITQHYDEIRANYINSRTEQIKLKYMCRQIIDKNTQTDNLMPKGTAPFYISIATKPVLLNTIVFSDSGDDVILKQHGALEWDKIVTEFFTLKQLVTWPHVEVYIRTPVFSITRRNIPEFKRHVGLVGAPLSPITEDLIDNMTIIDLKQTRLCYTTDYLMQMLIHEFVESLKKFYTPSVVDAFQTVIMEFLNDINEIDITRNHQKTLASNTMVRYHISGHSYFRNKKLAKGQPSKYDIGYTEIIIPTIEFALSAMADDNTFKNYCNKLKTVSTENTSMEPKMLFSCNYCTKFFENGGGIAQHLKEEHKMEQPVLCTVCKKPFAILDLSLYRWVHVCSGPPAKTKPVQR